MFLDPDPKQQSAKMSGFVPLPQSPSLSPLEATFPQRRPLQERSQSQNNQSKNSSRSPQRPTVRLVRPSPTPSSPASRDSRHLKENWSPGRDNFLRLRGDFEAFAGDGKPLADIRPLNVPVARTTIVPASKPPRPSGSTFDTSEASTFDDSGIALTQTSDWSEQISQGSTFLTIPSPIEQDFTFKATDEEDLEAPSQTHVPYTEPHHERGRSRMTVRAVSPSLPSDASLSRPPTADDELDLLPGIPRKSSKRSTSVPSILPLSVVVEDRLAQNTPVPRRQRPNVPSSYAESPSEAPSSPNFVSYSRESSVVPTQRKPLRYVNSIDSIGSRLQSSANVRPETGRSLAESSSLGSLQSSDDVLPPLRVPKKRSHHKPAFSSQASSSSQVLGGRYSEECDAPRPRHYSNNLSTIASESEHMSQMSMGSQAWPEIASDAIVRQATALPISRPYNLSHDGVVLTNLPSPSNAPSSSSGEPGDMTLGIFREESAVPQPLFLPSPPVILSQYDTSPARKQVTSKLPGSPENDEHFDTLTDLQAPPHLRQKRSGYSMRQRSNSTPSRSHSRQNSQVSSNDTERWSYGSSIFPVWAKHYYSGSIQLSRKVSSSTVSTPHIRPIRHMRNDSSFTDHSALSRSATSDSNHHRALSYNSSPFLPSILRSRLQHHAALDLAAQPDPPTRPASQSTHISDPNPRPDSLIVEQIPPQPPPRPFSPTPPSEISILPSGQPRWGPLKDAPTATSPTTPRRQLPKFYDSQRHWDSMHFPRPMTKDRMSDFGIHSPPHLTVSKRDSALQLSAWRPPSFSFTGSLDTLVRSRCNRQILLFALGFIFPPAWIIAAVLPLPARTLGLGDDDAEKFVGSGPARSQEDLRAAMMQHSLDHAEVRWSEERTYLKAKWWRILNRIMSVIGLLVIGAIIALAVVASR